MNKRILDNIIPVLKFLTQTFDGNVEKKPNQSFISGDIYTKNKFKK